MKTLTSTPKQDGYRMPGEFEAHRGVYILWPQRPDNWRNGGKPAQKQFVDVATAISEFEHVTVGVNDDQYENARNLLPDQVEVVEISNNDSWIRDCGATFVKNDQGGLRAVDMFIILRYAVMLVAGTINRNLEERENGNQKISAIGLQGLGRIVLSYCPYSECKRKIIRFLFTGSNLRRTSVRSDRRVLLPIWEALARKH